MTCIEWVKNELSYTDDHLTTTDRIMLNRILKALERLECLENIFKEFNEEYEAGAGFIAIYESNNLCIDSLCIDSTITITKQQKEVLKELLNIPK